MKNKTVSHDDYLHEQLKDPAFATEYLRAVMTDELDKDLGVFLLAVGHAAKAHGIADLASKVGRGRDTLYKALAENGNPTVQTLRDILLALGMRLSVEPIQERRRKTRAG